MDFLKFTGETTVVGAPIAYLDSQIWVREPTTDGKWYDGPPSPGLESIGQGKCTVMYKFY